MTSQIANQNRVERISWSVVSDSSTTYRQRITIPFLVDEIRVVSIGAQPTALSTSVTDFDDSFGRSITVMSPDLIGGSGTFLGATRVVNAERFTTFTITNRTISTSGTAFDTTPIRYIFPPSAKRNVNSTYTFSVQNLFGSPLPANIRINNFDILLAIEFIQYKETEKQLLDVDDDLRVLGKSGRRRL